MTAHGHAQPGAESASHDHYEGTPADRLGPGEPSTPLWLPLVGLGLVLVTLLAFVATRPAGKTGAELAQEAVPEAPAPVQSAAPPGEPPPGFRRAPGMPSVFIPNTPPPPSPTQLAAPPPTPTPTVSVAKKPFMRPLKPGPRAAPPPPPPPPPAPAAR